jgi:hypothetical protein
MQAIVAIWRDTFIPLKEYRERDAKATKRNRSVTIYSQWWNSMVEWQDIQEQNTS